MRKLEKFNRGIWIAAFCVVLVGVSVNGMLYSQIVAEEKDAAAKLAQIEERAKEPAQRYSLVDSQGVMHHTLCTGNGWCVTDRVPPEETTKVATARRGGGIPIVNPETYLELGKQR